MSSSILPEYFLKGLKALEEEDPTFSQIFDEVVEGWTFVEIGEKNIPYTDNEGVISTIDSLNMNHTMVNTHSIQQAFRLKIAFTKAKLISLFGNSRPIKV